jgi:hypothetical protein
MGSVIIKGASRVAFEQFLLCRRTRESSAEFRVFLNSHEFSDTLQFRYQLAFFMPGITPSWHMLRKQMRQILNLRYTARGRPHNWHRRSLRELNFGLRFAFSLFALLAIGFTILSAEADRVPA